MDDEETPPPPSLLSLLPAGKPKSMAMVMVMVMVMGMVMGRPLQSRERGGVAASRRITQRLGGWLGARLGIGLDC